MEYNHPGEAPDQLKLYREMGEVNYVAMRGAKARAIIAADKLRFVRLSLWRLYYFWFSVPHPFDEAPWNEYGRSLNFQFTSIAGLFGLALALRRRVPAAGLFAAVFLLLPLTYYFVAAHARFRHPFEPLIAILGVYLFQSAEKSWRVWPWRSVNRGSSGDRRAPRALLIEREQPGKNLLLGKIAGPAVGGEDCFVECAVRVGEPLRALVVELGEGYGP